MMPLSYAKKNKMLLPVLLLCALLCWVFVLNPLWDVWKQNSALQKELSNHSGMAFNPEFLSEKSRHLDIIVKTYEVKNGWRDSLWLKISDLLPSKNVAIVYVPELADATDTAKTVRQDIVLRGNFKSLIRLLDTAQKASGVGRISHIKLVKEKKNTDGSEYISMLMRFTGVRN